MPLAAVVNKKFFCVHGGISKWVKRLTEINEISDRFVEIPLNDDPMCDFMWSDPSDLDECWGNNYKRGCSYMWGYSDAARFLQDNKLKYIVRAHEVNFEGYKLHCWGYDTPTAITIFSAPNYTGQGNSSVIMEIPQASTHGGKDYVITPYTSVESPYFWPDVGNCWEKTFPYIEELLVLVVEKWKARIQTDEELTAEQEASFDELWESGALDTKRLP